MRTRESRNTFVIESHSIKHLAQMTKRSLIFGRGSSAVATILAIFSSFCVREVTFWGALFWTRSIHSTILHIHRRPTRKRNTSGRSHLVNVGVRDGGHVLFDRFQELHGIRKARVGAVKNLWFKANATNGTTSGRPFSLDILVKRTRIMPGESHKNGTAVLFHNDGINLFLSSHEIFLRHGEMRQRPGRSRRGHMRPRYKGRDGRKQQKSNGERSQRERHGEGGLWSL
mmetsp:Transcript_11275/g.21517  ORF Transcript_11275/g.21517 Transcript_11275/m.21517 type:complete len:228 (+) Transcript_11275:412-1095(+)